MGDGSSSAGPHGPAFFTSEDEREGFIIGLTRRYLEWDAELGLDKLIRNPYLATARAGRTRTRQQKPRRGKPSL